MSEAHSLPVIDPAVIRELEATDAGPRRTTSLLSRRSPLAAAAGQLELLDGLALARLPYGGDFARTVEAHAGELRTTAVEILQVNVGKLCNMTCRHCHVDAGPDRWREMMDRPTVDACIRALELTGAGTVDITGGAPELNPHFRHLVEESIGRGAHVIDRCNLTVLLLPRNRDLPGWLAERGVEVVCSLPHYRRRSTDAQRGEGTFERSIEALRRLNSAGYGCGDPRRVLTAVVNPAGAVLTGGQRSTEREWTAALARDHGVAIDRVISLNNMPIARFLEWLVDTGNFERYMELLVNAFNPGTVAGLMCRNTLSIAWDGRVYDCDFNQMLELEVDVASGRGLHVSELRAEHLAGRRIVTARHCFGCTAGAGSSCGGALDVPS